MVSFAKPSFPYRYNLEREIKHLDAHFKLRGVPRKSAGKTLVASWNIANLGDAGQVRSQDDLRLMAHILKRFDVVAIQEVKDNLSDFSEIMSYLGRHYEAVFTDPAGNNERMAFVYDSNRVQTRELFAELALVDRTRKSIRVQFKGKTLNFKGFNRNPFMVSFEAHRPGRKRPFGFTLVNVHIYYGAKSGRKLRNRLLEIMALSSWAQKRSRAKTIYDDDVILLGDMNLPSLKKDDSIFKTLKRRGLYLTEYSTNVSRKGTNLGGDRPYDQIAFFPKRTKHEYTGETGVFDFDFALFPYLYSRKNIEKFRAYMKYHISDHRLLWAAFRSKEDV